MVASDTNVFVRVLVGDDPVQTKKAALDAFATGKADLADYLIAGHARAAGQELFTFDKRLAREKLATLL